MSLGRRQRSLPRSAALIALAALAVHQLRYLLAYGSAAHHELAGQGHAYLGQSLPLVIGFGLAVLAAGLMRAALRSAPRKPMVAKPRLNALLYAASIALVFTLQEGVEGMLFAGHASGLAAVLAGGGWLALPLSLLFGALCVALDGSLGRLESLIAQAFIRGLPRAPRSQGTAIPRPAPPLAALPLAFGIARRPPPLAS